MYEHPFHYLTFGGSAYGGVEHWSCGLKLSLFNSPTPGTPQSIATAIAPHVLQWFQSPDPQFLSTHTLEFCKVAEVGVDGIYVAPDAAYEHLFLPPVPGPRLYQSGANQTLPQASLCITLRTAITRGYASKGRIYPPPQYYQMLVDGTANAFASYVQPVKTLINQINAEPLAGNVIIASRGKGVRNPSSTGHPRYTYPTVGREHQVTAVSVGRVVDTQRRRRRQLQEAPALVVL